MNHLLKITVKAEDTMKQKTRFSAIAAVVICLLLGTSMAQAAEVIVEDDTVTRIENLDVLLPSTNVVVTYDVDFRLVKGLDLYGQNLEDLPFGPPTAAQDALAVMLAINNALDSHTSVPGSAGLPGQNIYYIGTEQGSGQEGSRLLEAVGGENLTGEFWGPCTDASNCLAGVTFVNPGSWLIYADLTEGGGPPPSDLVDLTGTVENVGGTPLCALALASGQFMFTCNPNGPYLLLDLPTEDDGTVKRQVYVDGFFPNVERLHVDTDETVVMQRAGDCPDYNSFPSPGDFPGSAGKRIDISGKVLQQNSADPVCAMALANGEFGFTCDGTGEYSASIPLDGNGQYKLQVYAEGYAPMVQVFDENSPDNDVRLARASECQ
jgi:hypothetical protein